MSKANEILRNSENKDRGTINTSPEGNIKVFKVDGDGNTTYTKHLNWAGKTPYFFDIYNTSTTVQLAIEINQGGTGDTYTVRAGEALGKIGYEEEITQVEVITTDTFTLLLRR